MRLFPASALFFVSISVFGQTHALDPQKDKATLEAEAKLGFQIPAIAVSSTGTNAASSSTNADIKTPESAAAKTSGGTDTKTASNTASVAPTVSVAPKDTVSSNVGVTAVLLTQPSIRRLFGAEIANTYAVVQLTISNRSANAAFVLHTAYIDTTLWALGSGIGANGISNSQPWRTGTFPNRIDSVESRIARGQLLDAQQWSARNWTVRILTIAGSLAASYSFAFTGPSAAEIAKGIAAFNGTLVPGVAFAWPDGAVAQQNRISDFGYQTNKIVGKQLGDIVVCFFPIDTFLSPMFRKLFLKSPGLFLSPYQVLYGKENVKVLAELGLFGDLKGPNYQTNVTAVPAALRRLLPCYSGALLEGQADAGTPQPSANETQPTPNSTQQNAGTLQKKGLYAITEDKIFETCKAQLTAPENEETLRVLKFIGRFGLQNIQVYVDGTMTVDVNIIPASIDGVTFDGDASKPDFWAAAGTKSGTLQCRFCQGGQVSIKEADALGLQKVATITEGSTDAQLKFSFDLTKPVETGKSLTFVITKTPPDSQKGATGVPSGGFAYVVGYNLTGPTITKASLADKTVTVTGTGFFNTTKNPLVITMEAKGEKSVPVTLPATFTQDKLRFDLPTLPPGCWTVKVAVGTAPASASKQDEILSPAAATPKLTSATLTAAGDTITVIGEQLVDTSACKGTALTFKWVKKAGATTDVTKKTKLDSTTEATISVTGAASGDTVQILQSGSSTSVETTVKPATDSPTGGTDRQTPQPNQSGKPTTAPSKTTKSTKSTAKLTKSTTKTTGQ